MRTRIPRGFHASGSNRNAVAPLGPAAREYLASVLRAHADTEPVGPLASGPAGLVGAFHGLPLLPHG